MRKFLALFAAAGLLAAVAVPSVEAVQTSKTVKVGDYFFSPTRLKVSRGSKVTWKWVGRIVHNVTVTRGPASFSSRTQRAGSYSHVFTRRGSYSLVCTIHPSMTQTITVK